MLRCWRRWGWRGRRAWWRWRHRTPPEVVAIHVADAMQFLFWTDVRGIGHNTRLTTARRSANFRTKVGGARVALLRTVWKTHRMRRLWVQMRTIACPVKHQAKASLRQRSVNIQDEVSVRTGLTRPVACDFVELAVWRDHVLRPLHHCDDSVVRTRRGDGFCVQLCIECIDHGIEVGTRVPVRVSSAHALQLVEVVCEHSSLCLEQPVRVLVRWRFWRRLWRWRGRAVTEAAAVDVADTVWPLPGADVRRIVDQTRLATARPRGQRGSEVCTAARARQRGCTACAYTYLLRHRQYRIPIQISARG